MSDNTEERDAITILPPLMAVLIPVIRRFQELQGIRYYREAFEELELFYYSLTAKPQAEVKEKWQKFIEQKEAIKTNGGNIARRTKNQELAENVFLRRNSPKIYGAFIAALDKYGYFLENKNRPRTREKSMKDLELTIAEAKYGRKG